MNYREQLTAAGVPLEASDTNAVPWVAKRLTARQREALVAFGVPPRASTAVVLGVAGSTLASLSDFRRSERDIASPLMLVNRDFDCDGTPYWDITGFGVKVRDALATAVRSTKTRSRLGPKGRQSGGEAVTPKTQVSTQKDTPGLR